MYNKCAHDNGLYVYMIYIYIYMCVHKYVSIILYIYILRFAASQMLLNHSMWDHVPASTSTGNHFYIGVHSDY